ncbi:hypothetical protein [Alterinioella nitratireducens]|uniref:hypothetical protein n=1 Tax=Alterinioella nitratireducens TaxID=2735915 RepID=UPI001551FCFE|nr:hypothetical protein [Alterinioella nitratireducens]NPD21275.1 hypothetical protein [Alterinioella nitratireducens]
MCTICAAFRPFESDCSYETLGPQPMPVPTYANVAENPTSPAGTGTTNVMTVGDVFSGSLETLGDDG